MIEPEDVCAGSRVLYKVDSEQKLIATCRINIDLYPAFLIGALKIQKIQEETGMNPSYTSRLMVERGTRGGILFKTLIQECFKYTVAHNSYIGIFSCAPRLQKMFHRQGFRQYAPMFHHPYAGEQIPMMIIAERQFLKAIGSSFNDCLYPFNDALFQWFLSTTKYYNE